MLRSIVRPTRRSAALALLIPALVYALDYSYARFRTGPREDIPVDRMFAITNRRGCVEFSLARSGYERCVRSAFPHFGFVPCSHLRTQDVRCIKVG